MYETFVPPGTKKLREKIFENTQFKIANLRYN